MLTPRSEYLRQLDDVQSAIVRLADKTAADVRALGAAFMGDKDAAAPVLTGAKKERKLRGAIEDGCLEIMLLQQPLVAGDLRLVTGSFRLVSDLSHIDEMARDAAYLAEGLPAEVASKLGERFFTAAEQVASMAERAVAAFADADEEEARAVEAMDDAVDEFYAYAEGVVVDLIKASETRARHLPELLMAAKYLERMGDDAVRIANWAVFRVTGSHESLADAPAVTA